MTINTETALRWMSDHKGRVSYSMDERDGPGSYDCSSAVYYALMSAGAISAGWAVNTEYEHDWLIKNGYKLIAENTDWDAKRGDIFIWGKRGQSAGAGGHTGIFVDPDNIIHCNYANNSITINNYNQTAESSGWMYCYVYRLDKQPVEEIKEGKQNNNLEETDMITISAPGRGIALMMGGKFLPILDAKTPTVFWNQGVKHYNLDQKTFDAWQGKAEKSTLDDATVNKLIKGLK